MRILSNPFTSNTFSGIWVKHFNNNLPSSTIKGIMNIAFVKKGLSPFYENVGKTHTKGISYSINQKEPLELNNKVLLIYDVPTFFDLDLPALQSDYKLHRIKQYPGFLIHLDKYKDLGDYMSSSFSKSSRYKLNKYKKRLEESFDISYKMYFGDISRAQYDFIFGNFKSLLEKRFLDKGITNNNLDPKEWAFYYEVAYPLILERKASLFVIYEGTTPIGVTLNYFSENILFDAITVFDIDYEKFHLGSVTIMKLIEWSLENNIKIFDFSKGYFDYKKRWANEEYDFEYHLYYDTKSIRAKVIAQMILKYFSLKQILRDKKVNEKLHKLSFFLKGNKQENTPKITFEFSDVELEAEKLDLVDIDIKTPAYKYLTPLVFEFLYLNNEELKDIKVQQVNNQKEVYIISGKTITRKATINSITRS
ncbi:GNAT family N-acetyltransferase [Sediminicola sp. 1XM1-17]|uniref:GNAT family N-acetyltransferase n=1 Tax=Sediminicola sp. 1XM1-17 TaxID=3127702 RepID=UPI003077F2D2